MAASSVGRLRAQAGLPASLPCLLLAPLRAGPVAAGCKPAPGGVLGRPLACASWPPCVLALLAPRSAARGPSRSGLQTCAWRRPRSAACVRKLASLRPCPACSSLRCARAQSQRAANLRLAASSVGRLRAQAGLPASLPCLLLAPLRAGPVAAGCKPAPGGVLGRPLACASWPPCVLALLAPRSAARGPSRSGL